ncbi:hypothetical protein D3C78_1972430 [compost metagenome]
MLILMFQQQKRAVVELSTLQHFVNGGDTILNVLTLIINGPLHAAQGLGGIVV